MTTPTGNTPRQLIAWATEQLQEHELFYGHGTEDAESEAVYIVFESLGLDYHCEESRLDQICSDTHIQAIYACTQRRIETRKPAAYLLNRAWFAGLPFYVDERVLVPRSPLAELIEQQCAPWLQADQVEKVLEIGTGSGCIAIACAYAFPAAQVDAADISADALEVAQHNLEMHELQTRLRLFESDVYQGLPAQRYDLIISNPPYVPRSSMRDLPDEYRHEPELGLVAADRGLAIVNRILEGAVERLTDHGILVVEVGESQQSMMDAWPDLPLLWLEFEFGGEGVFLISASDLKRCLPRPSK